MLLIPPTFLDLSYSDNHPYEVELAHVGQGNWRAFRTIGISLSDTMDIARSWSAPFYGIDRPWLCWHVDDDWSMVQQRLVASVGWTPVVGFDPRVGPPQKTTPEAVVIDFNRDLGLPLLYPHFPLEFVFLFCKKIAFWHSDLLVRSNKLQKVAVTFDDLENGQTFAIKPRVGRREFFSTKKKRYWELLGCTTERASRDQFMKGCGWWMDYWAHPNQKQGHYIRNKYYWDHGAGIYYWRKREGGICKIKNELSFQEWHFTKIGNKNYSRFREHNAMSYARRTMSSEIKENFDLVYACKSLSLDHYLTTSD